MPKNFPLVTTLEPGAYSWCSCGKSATVPFCDGSHKGTGKKSVHFVIAAKEQVALCTCQKTKKPPHCDGSHGP